MSPEEAIISIVWEVAGSQKLVRALSLNAIYRNIVRKYGQQTS